ncbi:MAG: cyanophycin synthetase, partial [Xanthobacteraceae bacterium]
RGVRGPLDVVGGSATLIDESYNANPASMAAALGVLGGITVAGQGRRIAVLGDMLELGPAAAALHRGLVAAVTGNAVDLVFCCGPLMRHLWDALPSNRRGGYADDAAALESQVVAALRAGDVVMVKGSAGSRMKVIVAALNRRFAAPTARDGATA